MLSKQKVKYIQSLGQKKFRESEKSFIAEGPKLVKDLLEGDSRFIQEIFATEDWLAENPVRIANDHITIIDQADLERISQLSTPNKVLAIVTQYDESAVIETKHNIILALDTIQDPGNLGTIMRIADWFGVKQIVASFDSADMYNSKVVQASMGSIARIKLNYLDLAQWLSGLTDIPIYAASLEGKDVSSIGSIKEGVIIIGNESKGISPDVLQYSTSNITIKRKGKAESLNAAVAVGIILSHLVD